MILFNSIKDLLTKYDEFTAQYRITVLKIINESSYEKLVEVWNMCENNRWFHNEFGKEFRSAMKTKKPK